MSDIILLADNAIEMESLLNRFNELHLLRSIKNIAQERFDNRAESTAFYQSLESVTNGANLSTISVEKIDTALQSVIMELGIAIKKTKSSLLVTEAYVREVRNNLKKLEAMTDVDKDKKVEVNMLMPAGLTEDADGVASALTGNTLLSASTKDNLTNRAIELTHGDTIKILKASVKALDKFNTGIGKTVNRFNTDMDTLKKQSSDVKDGSSTDLSVLKTARDKRESYDAITKQFKRYADSISSIVGGALSAAHKLSK